MLQRITSQSPSSSSSSSSFSFPGDASSGGDESSKARVQLQRAPSAGKENDVDEASLEPGRLYF
jgi:hypothetical protein